MSDNVGRGAREPKRLKAKSSATKVNYVQKTSTALAP